MANNTIGWGQGATNNDIGWGRGYANDIGWGSVYENSYVGDTDLVGVTYLLDTYAGAAAAYSLRQLKSGVTNVVRVRADVVGQPEQDFTAAQITDGTLATFVGAGNNGYVVTWYDQSGSGNHAEQLTASQQPQIVASGVVITENGMPAVQFDGSDDYLQANDDDSLSFTDGSGNDYPISAFATFKIGNKNYGILFGKDDGLPNREYAWGYFGEFESRFFLKDNGGAIQISRDNKNAGQLDLHQISTMLYDASELSSGITFYSNGVVATMGDVISITYNGMANTTSAFKIGNYGASDFPYLGVIQEIILYPTDESSNRTNIEGNINGYYNIYP